jgi:hypothetical protein
MSGQTIITGAYDYRIVSINNNNLYVLFRNIFGSGPSYGISLYTTNGVLIDASYLTLPNFPEMSLGMSVDASNNLYIANTSNAISKYNSNKQLVTSTFITLSNRCQCIQINNNIFYVSDNLGKVGKYDTNGNAINANLLNISNLSCFSVYSGNIYTLTKDSIAGKSIIGKYDTSGNTINANLLQFIFSGDISPNVLSVNTYIYILIGDANMISVYDTNGIIEKNGYITELNGAIYLANSSSNIYVTSFPLPNPSNPGPPLCLINKYTNYTASAPADTILTNPSPLIQNQPGTITYYTDISYNDISGNTTYTLQNSNNVTLSTFTTATDTDNYSNYQTSNTTRAPYSICFDLFDNIYMTQQYSGKNGPAAGVLPTIIAFNPSYNEYTIDISYAIPCMIKFNSQTGQLFATFEPTLYNFYSPIGLINIPNYNYNNSVSTKLILYSGIIIGGKPLIYDVNLSPNPYLKYCSYPIDLVFDNSGNVLFSNNYYLNDSNFNGFITKLFINDGIVTDIAVIISNNTGTTTTSFGGVTGIPACYDPNLYTPTGMDYDPINNYLYVANNSKDASGNYFGQITMYQVLSNSITKLASFQNGYVGNRNFRFINAVGTGSTSLKLDNYNNLYYIYTYNSNTYVRAINPIINLKTNTNNVIFSHKIKPLILGIQNNSFYGVTFNKGNIYVSGFYQNNLRPNVFVGPPTNILQIQTAYEFSNVTLPAGLQSLQIIDPSGNKMFNINVPNSTLLLSNTTPYVNEANIVTYYDNPNDANTSLPASGLTYQLRNNVNTSNFVNVKMVDNNEEVYAPYSNELGNLNFPISMDFDSSGNLYVLNAPNQSSSNSTFITLITPNSGNFYYSYYSNLNFTYPTCIRYNKNDNCMYLCTNYNITGVLSNQGIFSNAQFIKIVTTTNTNGNKVNYVLNFINGPFLSNIFYGSITLPVFSNPTDIVFDASQNSGTTGWLYVLNSSYSYKTTKSTTFVPQYISKTSVVYDPTNNLNTQFGDNGVFILVIGSCLSNYTSGIAVDEKYIYAVSAPDLSNNDISYNNMSVNIAQFSNSLPNTLIQYWNAGYVGKLKDASYSTIQPVSSPLKFDQYGNLFYIYSYIPSGSTNAVVNVQAFVPSSGSGTPVYTHTMSTNPTSQIYGMALYGGDIYVAQYETNTIVKIINTFSFGNYGFGVSGSQSSLVLQSETNSYSLLGGNVPITNITIGANILNYAFNTATIITTPSPLIANTPGALYYYNNPATSSPAPNTSYNLLNSSNKVVSNTYTTTPGNEVTLIYIGLSRPSCITADNQGYLYIANAGLPSSNFPNGSITKCTTTGKIIYTIVNSNISNPYAIKFNPVDGYIYYANNSPSFTGSARNYNIYKMSTDGTIFTLFYTDATYSYLYNPYDLCFDTTGNMYVSNNYVTTPGGSVVNGSISKISITYPSGVATLAGTLTISNYLTGLTRNTAGYVSVSGIAIDTISDYLYVVTGTNDPSNNNVNISQIPLTGNDAGCVCRKWQTGQVGNSNGQTSLSFDPFGNLYYYYYYKYQGIDYCALNALDPYANKTFTYAHDLLGGALAGAYGLLYYNGNLYSTQSALSISSGNYINNLVQINTSYYFTGVTLQGGENVLAIQNLNLGKKVIENIQVYVPQAKYYTIPAPPVAGQPAQLFFEYLGVIEPINGHQYVVVDSNMNYVSGIFTGSGSTTFTFPNLILPGGGNYLYIFDLTLGQIVPGTNMFIKIPVVCFYKGTKILCAINGKETYVPIEKIGQGTLVKTYKHGFKKVKYNIKGKLNNTSEHNIDKLFKLSKKRFPELTEDLYVTGSHALLHDSLTPRDAILMRKVIEYAAANYKSVYHAKIEDKFKLLAYHDERFEEIMQNAVFEIYHIVLENEDQCYNYGIYANGVLAESTDELTLMRMKGFEKINKTSEKMEQFLIELNKTKYPSQVRRALRNN